VFDSKSLEQLGPITDEMLGGLHADEAMRLRIKRAAMEGAPMKKRPARRLVPAVCCAALALCCVGVWSGRLHKTDEPGMLYFDPAPVMIDSIAAGENAAFDGTTLVADLNDNARVRAASASGETLFASGGGDIPLLAIDGAIYQMLKTPQDIGASLLDAQVGSVQTYDEQPSLASPKELNTGLSNVAQQGTVIHQIKGLPVTTAVAAEVNGSTRVFQRRSTRRSASKT